MIRHEEKRFSLRGNTRRPSDRSAGGEDRPSIVAAKEAKEVKR